MSDHDGVGMLVWSQFKQSNYDDSMKSFVVILTPDQMEMEFSRRKWLVALGYIAWGA